MANQHVVVDGSNIATEGRSVPSLAQLESAVAELRKDMADAEVIVVVDATFAHRIDSSELPRFEEAALQGAYVSPPAGAIGRGDAFLLRIAEKVGAMVLSNDSFQEFHGEHPWLFESGRLLGATPVAGVGWIFVPRTPVRGPRSRVAVRDAARQKSLVQRAIADATKEVSGSERPSRRSRARASVSPEANAPMPTPKMPPPRAASGAPPSAAHDSPRAVALNEPLQFISFIAEHPLGASVEGVVDSFTSHGAVVLVDSLRCYVPLSGLAVPAPRSAREVLRKEERRTFVVTALDPNRRGVELALPGIGEVRGVPSDETVEGELEMSRGGRRSRGASSERPASRRRRGAPGNETASALPETEPTSEAPPGRARPVKTAAVKKAPAKRTVVKAAPAEEPVPEPTPAPAKKTAARTPAKKAAAKKAAAKAAPPAKKAAAKKAAPAKAAEAPAKKSAAKKAAAPAKKAPAKKAAPAKAAPATAKKAAAKKATPKKAAQ